MPLLELLEPVALEAVEVLLEEVVVVPELEEVVVPELEEVVVVVDEELELLEVPQGPHVPSALPTAMTQVSPGQQSALTEHFPQLGTQEPPWKQM
jgi:hypothetical protein